MNLWKGNVAVVILACSNRGQEKKKTNKSRVDNLINIMKQHETASAQL